MENYSPFQSTYSDVNSAIYTQSVFCSFSFSTLRKWEKREMMPRVTKDISGINTLWKKKIQIFASIVFPWIMIHLLSQLDKAGKKILKRAGHAFRIQ